LSFSKNLPDPEATQQRYQSNDKESKQQDFHAIPVKEIYCKALL
jgi:hypothetical protein